MTIIGMNYSTNSNGLRVTTLHVTEPFNAYYSNAESGRGCIGDKVETIYVGTYDCSNLEIGMEIDVLYDKAVHTKNGTYQPIKRIEVIA